MKKYCNCYIKGFSQTTYDGTASFIHIYIYDMYGQYVFFYINNLILL